MGFFFYKCIWKISSEVNVFSYFKVHKKCVCFAEELKLGFSFLLYFSFCNSMMDKKSMLCSFLFKIFSFAKDKIAQGNVNPVWLNVIDITFLTENEKDRPFTLLLVINSGETSRIYVNLMFISECVPIWLDRCSWLWNY